MSKLGEEIRASYERQQSGLGEVADARHRLIHNALTAPARESHRLQWAAAIAAVLVAAIVIAAFGLVRGNIRPQAIPGTTPRANASPTPLRNVITVADATPLILYQDPAETGQLDGVTWDGKTSGKLSAPQAAAVGNPQNNLFGSADSVVDRSGATVMTGTFGAKSWQATWADDGTHFCEMVPFSTSGAAGVPTTLQLVTVGQGARNVARIGTLHEQTFVSVAACSTRSDRAVIVQSGGQGFGTAGVWVVQLSTGTVLWAHTYDVAATAVTVVASPDARFVAENLTQGKPAGSTIYGPDGKTAADLSWWVDAFSWDDNLVVVDDGGFGSAPVHLLLWRDGAQVWSGAQNLALLRAAAEPDGTEMALWLAPSNQFRFETFTPDLYVLGFNGAVVLHVASPA